MIDHSRLRHFDYFCEPCRNLGKIPVPYGCSLKFGQDKGTNCSYIEIHEERPGLDDRFFESIVCSHCGCVGGISFDSVKIHEETAQEIFDKNYKL